LTARPNILPDPRFSELRPFLADRLAKVSALLSAENFAALLDPLMADVIRRGFDDAGAHEGTVWLLDTAGQALVPAYNTGPNADRIVGKFRQPLNAGIICMVLASEQPFVENEACQNSKHSKLLDSSLGVQTYALIAVPFYLFNRCLGVVSCVQLKKPGSNEPAPPGFDPGDLKVIQRAVDHLTRLLEYRLLGATVGWSSE